MDGYEMTEKGRSSNGGWSKAQLELIGVAWPPEKGWRNLLRKARFAEHVAGKFVEMKDEHLFSARVQ